MIDWGKAPVWANWYAINEIHKAKWFEFKPFAKYGGYGYWRVDEGRSAEAPIFDKERIHLVIWGNSAVKRPDTINPTTDKTQQTLSERGSRYGKFSDLSVIDQALKQVMQQAPNWDSLEPHHKTALEMIQHKVARILNGDPDYADSWHDIGGYSSLIDKFLSGDDR